MGLLCDTAGTVNDTAVSAVLAMVAGKGYPVSRDGLVCCVWVWMCVWVPRYSPGSTWSWMWMNASQGLLHGVYSANVTVPVHIMRYEDLCLRPAATLERVLAFVGNAAPAPAKFNATVQAMCSSTAAYFGRYLVHLSEQQLAHIVHRTRDVISAFNYTGLVERYVLERQALGAARPWPQVYVMPAVRRGRGQYTKKRKV